MMPSLYSPALHGVQLRPKSRHFSCLRSSSLYYALRTERERRKEGGGGFSGQTWCILLVFIIELLEMVDIMN